MEIRNFVWLKEDDQDPLDARDDCPFALASRYDVFANERDKTTRSPLFEGSKYITRWPYAAVGIVVAVS